MAKEQSSKHKEFIDQYFIEKRNVSAAYSKVYPKCKNPDVNGWKLMGKTSIQKAIAEKEKAIAERNEITQDQIIKEMAMVAFGASADLFDWKDGQLTLKDKKDLTSDQLRFIESIQTEIEWETVEDEETGEDVRRPAGTKIKVRTLANQKVQALVALNDMLGFDKEKSNGGAMAILMAALQTVNK